MNKKQLPWSVKRAMCEKVRRGEWTVDRAAKATGRNAATIRRWLDRVGPVEGSSEEPEAGPKTKTADPQVETEDGLAAIEECPWPEETRDLVDNILKRRPHLRRRSLQAHLKRHHGLDLPRRELSSYLRQKGLLRPRSIELNRPPRRFEASAPLQLLQVDIFYIKRHGGEFFYGLSVLDDHSRMVLGVPVMDSEGGPVVLEAFKEVVDSWAVPARVLTDQGTQFVSRKGRTAFQNYVEDELWATHIVASAAHPQTLGKVERFHRTLREQALTAEAGYRSCEEAQRVVDHFLAYYNYVRPHEGLGGITPADRFFRLAQPLEATLHSRPSTGGLYVVLNLAGRRLVIAGETPERVRVLWDDELPTSTPPGLKASGENL